MDFSDAGIAAVVFGEMGEKKLAVEAAKDAMQWVFTPALQQKKPVDVWVAIPFRFRLKDAQK